MNDGSDAQAVILEVHVPAGDLGVVVRAIRAPPGDAGLILPELVREERVRPCEAAIPIQEQKAGVFVELWLELSSTLKIFLRVSLFRGDFKKKCLHWVSFPNANAASHGWLAAFYLVISADTSCAVLAIVDQILDHGRLGQGRGVSEI